LSISFNRYFQDGVNVVTFTGRLTDDELVEFFQGLDPHDPRNAIAWIYYAPDADFSTMTVGSFTRLKDIVAPKVAILKDNPEFCSIIVTESMTSDMVANFWRDYISRDKSYPVYPILFSDLQGACQWLELPAEVARTIMGELREPEGAQRPSGTAAS
jgi:hypothetical protein